MLYLKDSYFKMTDKWGENTVAILKGDGNTFLTATLATFEDYLEVPAYAEDGSLGANR